MAKRKYGPEIEFDIRRLLFKCVHQKIVVYGKHMQQHFTINQLKLVSTQVDQALKSEDRYSRILIINSYETPKWF